MSITNRHSVVPFTAGVTQALADQRLAKIQYKSSKTKKALYKNHAVSIPKILREDVLNALNSHPVIFGLLQDSLESKQDELIKSLFESSKGTVSSIGDDEISINAIVNFLSAQSEDDRLKKADIEAWFSSEVEENLKVLLCEKFKHEDMEAENVVKNAKIYKDVLSMLAGPVKFSEKQIKGCETVFGLAESQDHWVLKKLIGRIEQMKKPVVIEEMIDLD